MKHLVLAATLALAGCAQQSAPGNDATTAPDGSVPLSPGVSPVRIGEGGPGFDACGRVGAVVNLSPSGEAYLPLRTAPFVEAKEIGRLTNGRRLYVCTRSMDQKWQGVVVPPADAPDLDCRVSAPIAAPRAYDGPCQSGWVSTAFVKPVAG
ncbi:MAG: hypothetical protein B7Y45_12945 [Sphingomonas sp. 28-66-16]|nr:MAG: hypothetical protein B7Y45_12945 [Sphingomonas sp. 28-66-16]